VRALALLAAVAAFGLVQAQERPHVPSITVTGNAEVMAAPDLATVRLGVTAEAPTAQAAQEQANTVVQRVLQRLADLRIPREDVQTARVVLSPVYSDPRPGQQQPQITGYRAQNILSVRLRDFTLVGRVIDAGLAAGVNTIEGVEFSLRDAAAARSRALAQAVVIARAKADAIATALGVQIVGVIEVQEVSGGFVPRTLAFARGGAEMDASTPVEPGELQINGTVTIRYSIRQ
jgi:uncharacterized protein